MSTPSVNPGLVNLMQSLASINSPILSSPKAVAALQKASPSDIILLSAEATKLQGLNALFGDSSYDSSASSTDPFSAFTHSTSNSTSSDSLAALQKALADAKPGTASPAVATALANYSQSIQSDLTDSLFGSATNTSVFG